MNPTPHCSMPRSMYVYRHLGRRRRGGGGGGGEEKLVVLEHDLKDDP